MPNELFGFEWRIAANGYAWRQVVAEGLFDDEPGTSIWVLDAEEGGWRTYRPLEKATGLYQEFADLEPTRQAFEAFANQYGHLGTHLIKDPPDWDDARLDRERQVMGERFADWQAHILVMKDAVRVWDLYSMGETGGIVSLERKHQLFTTVPGHREAEDALMEGGSHAEETFAEVWNRDDDPRRPHAPGHPVRFDTSSDSAILKTAKAFVMREVNAHLSENGVNPGLRPDASDRPRFYVIPRTLLGAMWLQFAEAISQQKEYRRCGECGRPFEVSSGSSGARSDSKFCSSACRTEYHNQKRRDVKTLRTQGKSLREIAKKFDADVPTVRRWLGETKAPKKSAWRH